MSPVNEAFLLDFILGLLSAWFCGFILHLRNMRAFGLQFALKNFPLTFVQLENRTVKTSIGIEIFQSYGVVLLV